METPELMRDVIKYDLKNGHRATAREYAPRMGMTEAALNISLAKWCKKYNWKNKNFDLKAMAIIPGGSHEDAPAVVPSKVGMSLSKPAQTMGILQLNDEENAFLERFRTGDLSFEEAQRELAYRVFKRCMEDPRLLKVSDWLKSEVIKIQREELSMKKEQMERSWAMIFGSFKFPKNCPNCGFDLQPRTPNGAEKATVIDGDELIDDSQSDNTPGIY